MSFVDPPVILTTGAASGIGAASAALLGERGWRVALVDRDAEALQTLHGELSNRGIDGLPFALDITDEDGLEAAVATTLSHYGRLDAVFANAARMAFGSVLQTTLTEWRSMIDINLTGTYLTIRACLPPIIDGGGGVVIATSSDVAVRTTSNSAAYVSSKHAVIGLIRSVAVDYGHEGVRANVLIPGVTDTRGVREVYSTPGKTPEQSLVKAADLSPLGRVATPADVAKTVSFLCSEDASFITGAAIVVDGGMTITYGAD